ncbi:MAG TPA: SRPBCC family protein [Polyangiaceae bacterium]|jgi:ligand-binding SRPBCC domain-containing protein
MTTLENSIFIAASPDQVWKVLARLDGLAEYDPAIAEARIETRERSGLLAERRCELKDGNWFRERVTAWEPERALAFELCECSFPVRSLAHRYQLTTENGGTRVEQRMQYELKLGPLGAVLDALLVRRQWNAGIRAFFAGLKDRVESPDEPRQAGPDTLHAAPS